MTVLVTGAAGFIGYSLAARLLREGESVYGIDNLCPYYDVALKEARLALLRRYPGFRFLHLDIADRAAVAGLFEGERAQQVEHLLFASSSSVYGANRKLPFSEEDNVDHPITLYAATKKANELTAHSYAHLYGLPCTGLRFFTVYGPWVRPDMALFKFARGIVAGEKLPVFNEGRMVRDFTYIDDVVEAVVRLLALPLAADSRDRDGPNGDGPNGDDP